MWITKHNILFLVLLAFFAGCAKPFYLSPDGTSIAKKHGIIAILPPVVVLEHRENTSAESLKIKEKDQSKIFQQEIYTYVLKRKSKSKDDIEIQDVDETNVILKKNGIDLSNMSVKDICETLQVDGVLSSQFSVSKPMPIVFAFIFAFLSGESILNQDGNDVVVTLSLKDCSSESLIWKYDNEYSGNIFSTPTSLVELLMRDASKRMPYFH